MPRDTLIITPWGDYSELIQLKDAFYNPSQHSQRRSACETVRTWELLGNVPHAVVATAELTNALMFDSEGNGGAWDRLGIYMSAWTRFVDGMTDTQQIYRVKRSMYDVARDLGMPAAFVELRHRAVHEQKPTLLEFRREVRNGLSWLFQWFWAYVVPEDGGDEDAVAGAVVDAAGSVAKTRTGTGTGPGSGGAQSTTSERQRTLRLMLKKRIQTYLAECRSLKASNSTTITANKVKPNKKKDHHDDQTSPASNSVSNHAATSFAEDMLTLYGNDDDGNDDDDDAEEGLLRELARCVLLEGAKLGDQKGQKGQRATEMEADPGNNARRRGKEKKKKLRTHTHTQTNDTTTTTTSNDNNDSNDNDSNTEGDDETSFSFPPDLETAVLSITRLLPHFVLILEEVLLTTIALPSLPLPLPPNSSTTTSSLPSSSSLSDRVDSDRVCSCACSLLIQMHVSDEWQFARETGLLDRMVAGEVCGEYGNGNEDGNRWTRAVLEGLSLA